MTDPGDAPHLPTPTPLGDPPAVPPDAPPVQREQPPRAQVDLSRDDVPCRNCGFNLRGLTEDGNCPECGSPIWNSIQEDLLIYSSEPYLKSLYRGVSCILIAGLINITFLFFGIVIALVIMISIIAGGTAGTGGFGATMATSNMFNAIMQLVSLPIALLSLYGWWLFSAPDPGQRRGDTGQTPRQTVRIAIVTLAAINVLMTVAQFSVMANPSLALIAGGLSLIALVAVVVQFFAAMLYIRWTGHRIPDADVEKRAQQYMWLLPVIAIGAACLLGFGPLVAWIMYMLLLNKVRLLIRNIIQRKQHGAGNQPVAIGI